MHTITYWIDVVSYEEDLERRKKAAKEKRKELYQRAKIRKKEYEVEMKRKIDSGEMEVPAAWAERERKKNEQKAEAKRKRKELYQARKKRQLNKKKADRAASLTESGDLWNKIVTADALENLRELAKKGQHLRIVKQDPVDS